MAMLVRVKVPKLKLIYSAFCILSPKINDDVPIKNETIVRIFCVIAGIKVIGIFISELGSSANTNE